MLNNIGQAVANVGQTVGNFLGASGPANEITTEAVELQRRYKDRQSAFGDWYDLLKMIDKLKQAKMESFVGNDPRTIWNMAVYLLQPKPLNFRIEHQEGIKLGSEAQDAANAIQQYFSNYWRQRDELEAKRMRQGFFRQFTGLMLITGWYAMPNMVDMETGKPMLDYYHPATIFPEPSDEIGQGLSRLARIRKLTSGTARALNIKHGWGLTRQQIESQPVEHQLWRNNSGEVSHGIAINSKILKSMTVEPSLHEIPVLVGVVGGLPDDGVLDTSYTAQQGQSILATNHQVFNNYNRQQTFVQQLLRDVANPRVKVRASSQNPTLVQQVRDHWYDRGPVFSMGPNDDVGPIEQPSIPVELSSAIFGLRNHLQKGGFSDTLFGNILQELNSVIITQSAEAAQQLLSPYHDGIVHATGHVTNNWYQVLLGNSNMRPKALPDWPDELQETRVVAHYAVKIPGDLQNRANTAKFLNPRFELPLNDVYEMLMPEVTNPSRAVAQLAGERARSSEEFALAYQIMAFREASDRAERLGNREAARLFDAMAGILQSKVTGQPSPEQRLGTAGTGQTGLTPTNMPPALQARMGGTRQ